MNAREMNRRGFLKGVGLGAVGLAASQILGHGASSPASIAARPNVILVMTDDQGYGDLGCLGNPAIRTPHVDLFHRRSVRLTNFHVSPTCSPTRASLMTGRNCNRTGVWHTVMGRSLLRADEQTMANVFAAGGYATGIFGKWHLGDAYPFRPQDRGFQEVLVHGGGGIGQTPDSWGNFYQDDTYCHNGTWTKYKGYCTDVWFTEARKFMADRKAKGQPFFCYLPTNAPHSPYVCPKEYWQAYQTAAGKSKPGVSHAAFYGMITNIDDNFGRLAAFLKEQGLEDNTILIFMTDNGSSSPAFNAGMRGGKGSAYDGGHRVPCFVRWPAGGITGARDITTLSAHVDLLPTLAALCGLTRPPGGLPLDGVSLAPLLLNQRVAWPDRAIVVDSQRLEQPVKWRQSAVMTEQWRLVNGKELYDIHADPGQKTDVSAAHAGEVARLRRVYEDWWKSISTRFGEYCPIVLGNDHENPTTLNAMDWHTSLEQIPYNQGQVRRGLAGNGFWAVQIDRDGDYEFELRRWPAEADIAIDGAPKGGQTLAVGKARLKIAGVNLTLPVAPGARAVVFRTPLKSGAARLQTWLIDDTGATRGAYYVYVKRRP